MKWFHAIGICGKATSNVAKMFKDMGWFVTGSDLQFFPPASTFLENNNIPTVEGYSYEHLTKEFWMNKLRNESHSVNETEVPDKPDLCLIVDIATPQNKEYLYAKKHEVDVRTYASILGEYLVKPESIVVIGTAGKTTTTALITKALKELNLNPSYMIGAEVKDISESLQNTDSKWSVLEGDEYHSLELSNGAKFLEYKPKYLIITKITWEHQDIFPTEELYIEEFRKAVLLVPEDGLIIAKHGDKNIDEIIKSAKCKVVRYGAGASESNPEYYYENYLDIKNGNEIDVRHNGERIFASTTNLLGDYNLENITAVVALLNELSRKSRLSTSGSETMQSMSRTVAKFQGPRKRLEILYKSSDLVVVDDFGVVPERAQNSLKTLKSAFPDYKIIGIFEPNSASRMKDLKMFNDLYRGVFENAVQIIIPDLSTSNSELATANEITKRLNALGFIAGNISSNNIINELKSRISANPGEKTLIVFFSSYRLTSIAVDFVNSLPVINSVSN